MALALQMTNGPGPPMARPPDDERTTSSVARTSRDGDRLLTLSAPYLRGYTDEDLRDLESYFDPTAILLTDATTGAPVRRLTSALETPVVDPAEPGRTDLDRTTLVTAPGLDDATSLLDREFERPATVVTGFIEHEYDPHTFETRFSGLSAYQDLVGDRLDIRTHLTTTLPAGQPIGRAAIPLYGAGFVDSPDGAQIPCLTLAPQPVVEELDRRKVGLEAIPGVGRSMRRQLHRIGCTHRRDVLDLEPTDLLELDGFGPYYAARVTTGARAIERGEPLRFVPDPLADRRRIYVDIETDSLSPRYIWQIGVYDDASEEYHVFVNDDEPGRESAVVEDFAAWVAANARDGTFVAWYGEHFDFVHLTEFIGRHAQPTHQEAWNDVDTFDLLCDFVRPGVATPARSQKLDVVADRLGYEREYPGLSGAQAAQAYAKWTAGDPMDWERWISYCRDDVLATKYVYEELADAEMVVDKRDLERAYHRSSGSSNLDQWDDS